MKHHGNYILPTPEELALNVGLGKESDAYIAVQLERIRKKHHNTKRHLAKNKNKRIGK